MDTVKVLSTMQLSEELLRELRAVSPRLCVQQITTHTSEELAGALAAQPGTEVLYTFGLPPDVLGLVPRLRWIQLHSAGADHLLSHPIMKSEILITTTSGIHATPIAEYVFASILAHRWQVPLWTRCQRERRWPSGRWDLFARPELRGSTMGIIGYGSIGREVGRLGQAFGMRVLAMRRSADRVEAGYAVPDTGDPRGLIPARLYPPEAMHEMLAECDYVVVALPLTPGTHHAIGAAELQAMKPTAFLVNISRGSIVDEAAVVDALRTHRIAGAGLDVFEHEPLPDDSPLWDLDNALISPHVAGFSPHYDERATALFAENLRRYLAGGTLLNVVDRSAGY